MRFLKAIMLSSILSVFAMSCSNGHSVIQTDYNQCKVKCVNLDFLCSYSLRGTAPLFNIFTACTTLSEGCYRKCAKHAGKSSSSGSHSSGGGGGHSSSSRGGSSSSGGGSGGGSHEILGNF